MALSVVAIAGASPFATAGDDAPERQPAAGSVQTEGSGFVDADAELVGEGINDTAGSAVAPAGDVNGDGHADVLVGAPRNDSAGTDAGAVYVVYGPVDSGDISLSDADVRLTGAGEGNLAGLDVAASDLDGDGHSDVVVGAPFDDSAGSNAGAVYVVYGSPGLSGTVSLTDADVILDGAGAGDQAGRSVATVNGSDGVHDLVVGAPRNDSAGTDSGAAYVLDGSDLASGSLADATAFVGTSAGDLAGSAVSSAGDFDGDGVEDVVVGARHAGDDDAGAAYVVPGDARFDGGALPDSAVEFAGAGAGDEAGYAVSGAGDFDGDGYDDVIVGAPLDDSAGSNTGAAYVVYGSDEPAPVSLSDADLTLRGEGAGDRAGWSVSAAGDVDCDSFDDVLVGAPSNNSTGPNAGAAYLVHGGDASGERSLGDADSTFHGTDADDRAGWSVAGVENASGDDVLVGAPYDDTAGTDAGVAALFGNECPEEGETPTETPTATESPAPGTTSAPTPTPSPAPTPTPGEPTVAFPDCHSVEVEGDAGSVVVFLSLVAPEDPDGDGVIDGFSTHPYNEHLGTLDGQLTREYDESVQVEAVFVYEEPIDDPNSALLTHEFVREHGEPAVRVDNDRFEGCIQEFKGQYETETPAPTPTETPDATLTETPTTEPGAGETTTTTENVDVSVEFLDCRSAQVEAPEGYSVRYSGFAFVETGNGAAHPNWIDPIREDEWAGGQDAVTTGWFYPDDPGMADRAVLAGVSVYDEDWNQVASAGHPEAGHVDERCGRQAECEAVRQGFAAADPETCEGDVEAASSPSTTTAAPPTQTTPTPTSTPTSTPNADETSTSAEASTTTGTDANEETTGTDS